MGVLLGICYLLFFIFVPLYDKVYWPEPTKQTLTYKMIAATTFVCIGVIGMIMTGNTSLYAYLMIIGLVFGWVGDWLMHIPYKTNMIYIYVGVVSFLVGHIFYVTAFIKTSAALNPDYTIITIPEIIAFVIIYFTFALMLKPVFKFNFDSKFIQFGVYGYSLFLVVMLVKIVSFSLTYLKYGADNNIITAIILFLGGICFFISDFTLGLRILGGRKDSKLIKSLSLYTYFFAQMLLATSISFIKG